jgi:hypothetical protein
MLNATRTQQNSGSTRSDCRTAEDIVEMKINRIQKLVEENTEHLLKSWDEYFNG